ncbi:MAG TPA: Gfo/Idh/MocA family oxidoreductase [Candidatus Eremiobacteraceae bacterium]|nr:Gfo/Idh/MocA family oxidoreductase [Candidatus Eremiobacteraceae bacterium]
MTPDLRVGVIGAGYWGKNLVRASAELGVLAAACDADRNARAALSAAYPGVTICGGVEEILALEIDAVIVATPAPTHAPIALAALAAGKHVFVEKPLALEVEDGERIDAAAHRAGKIAFVGHLLLYHPAVRRLREVIAQGSIGETWHFRSRRIKLGIVRSAESVWWSFAPHDVALMIAVLGAEPVAATAAQVGVLQPAISDMTYADFQFGNGSSAHIEVSWLDPQALARVEVFGTEGVLVLEDSRAGSSLRRFALGARSTADGRLEAWRGDTTDVEISAQEPLRAELLAFLHAVRTGEPPETGAAQGIAVLRALRMVDRAASRTFAARGVPA